MKTVLFSALFGVPDRHERIAFVERLQSHLEDKVQLVAFNTSTAIDSCIPVYNTEIKFKPNLKDIEEKFHAFILDTCPDILDQLLAHTWGEAAANTQKYHINLSRHIRLTQTFIAALDKHNPDYVFLWNQFNALHRHFAKILDARGIQYGFFHDGLLPGSVAFDFDGEMGESWIARNPDQFQAIPVDVQDRRRAQEFLTILDNLDTNRHTQHDDISVPGMLEILRRNDRPLVFFAGQMDWHAGLCPDGPGRIHHSPIYKNSLQALAHLDEVAGRLGVFILFKPHPISRDKYTFLAADDYPNTLILHSTTLQSCIEAADVVATIASQTCYVALMAMKPVMMLGRNQLVGKDLTYDLQDRDGLEDLIRTAIQDPLATARRDGLADHVARLEQAYLYDFGTLDVSFYRHDAATAAQMIELIIQGGSEAVINHLHNT